MTQAILLFVNIMMLFKGATKNVFQNDRGGNLHSFSSDTKKHH